MDAPLCARASAPRTTFTAQAGELARTTRPSGVRLSIAVAAAVVTTNGELNLRFGNYSKLQILFQVARRLSANFSHNFFSARTCRSEKLDTAL
ncbi:MAG TPA: hypothetical protein VER76_19220 [Pyrinomonadaceae bacterium]|nr:hypothetical protein [Pyrinomonadaceae bacterium]